ncbi:MAG: hypothetical protein H7Z42_05325 [Roseiflexaceae bacterium]|nr:hypothetical protein [Roseiflexaceae bacterium]
MIAFQDFIPQRQGPRISFKGYENLHELVSRANRWVEQHQIDVINIETVILSHLPGEEESPKVKMDAPSMALSVYQIVRVWYRQSSAISTPYTGQTTRLGDTHD